MSGLRSCEYINGRCKWYGRIFNGQPHLCGVPKCIQLCDKKKALSDKHRGLRGIDDYTCPPECDISISQQLEGDLFYVETSDTLDGPVINGPFPIGPGDTLRLWSAGGIEAIGEAGSALIQIEPNNILTSDGAPTDPPKDPTRPVIYIDTNTNELYTWNPEAPSGPTGTGGWTVPISGGGVTGAVQGVQGPTGGQGDDGNQGPDGNPGPDGNTGADGADGTDGTDGADGNTGADGNPGPDGNPGATGADGADGADGNQGPDGNPGPDGATGADGNQGPDGNPGPDGATGADGNQGPDGNPGATGADGADGNPGVTGAQGADGAPGSDGVTGADGAQGADGITGAQGADGITGAQGADGVAYQDNCTYEGLNWNQIRKEFTHHNPDDMTSDYGQAVAISGNTWLVGSPDDDGGRVFVYQGQEHIQTLTETSVGTIEFGKNLDLSCDQAIIGSKVSVTNEEQDFAVNDGDWTPSGVTTAPWEYGLSTSSLGGGTGWETNLDGLHFANSNEYLESPLFSVKGKNLDNLSITMSYDIEPAYDGVNLWVSSDGGAYQLIGVYDGSGTSSGNGTNWYNDSSIAAQPGPNSGSLEGWSGNSSGDVTATHDLSFLGSPSSIQFQLYLGSDGGVEMDGFLLRNFEVNFSNTGDQLGQVSTFAQNATTNLFEFTSRQTGLTPYFGTSLAVSNSTFAIGDPEGDPEILQSTGATASGPGHVYLYQDDLTPVNLITSITGPPQYENLYGKFGHALDLCGDTLVVGDSAYPFVPGGTRSLNFRESTQSATEKTRQHKSYHVEARAAPSNSEVYADSESFYQEHPEARPEPNIISLPRPRPNSRSSSNTLAKSSIDNLILYDSYPEGSSTFGTSSQNFTNNVANSHAADDFILSSNSTLTSVEWVGTYFNGGAIDEPDLQGFHIEFYYDNGGGTGPIYTGTGGTDPSQDAFETYFIAGNAGQTSRGGGLFSYAADLTPPLGLTGGVRYWISIQAAHDFPPQWSWIRSRTYNGAISVIGFPILSTLFWTPNASDLTFRLLGTQDDPIPNVGLVRIYNRDQGGTDNWGMADEIFYPGTHQNSLFGRSIAVGEDTFAVGTQSDELYIYELQNEIWTQVAEFDSDLSNIINGNVFVESFGQSLAISGSTLVAGDPESGDSRNGRVYLYQKNASGDWEFVRSLYSPENTSEFDDTRQDSAFGTSVSISGDKILIGNSDPLIYDTASVDYNYDFNDFVSATVSVGPTGNYEGAAVFTYTSGLWVAESPTSDGTSLDTPFWTYHTGSTPSGSPSDDQSGGGGYMYCEMSSTPDLYNPSQLTATLNSPVFSISATSAVLSFWYNMSGNHSGILSLDILDNVAVLVEADIFTIRGVQPSGWNRAVVDLTPWVSGTGRRIRFKATRVDPGSGGDIAIDTFQVSSASNEQFFTQRAAHIYCSKYTCESQTKKVLTMDQESKETCWIDSSALTQCDLTPDTETIIAPYNTTVSPTNNAQVTFIESLSGSGIDPNGLLEDGTQNGQIKYLVATAIPGGTYNLDVSTNTTVIDTNGTTKSTLSFTSAGKSATLIWNTGLLSWIILNRTAT